MSRRQRAGRGGKDHHGCGTAGCFWCSPGRDVLGLTSQELRAELDMRESVRDLQVAELRNWPEDAADADNGAYSCRCVTCGEAFVGHKRRLECKLCARATRCIPGGGC